MVVKHEEKENYAGSHSLSLAASKYIVNADFYPVSDSRSIPHFTE
jgi:hypothetical protein